MHVDMDCFYCSVEAERFPHLRLRPLAVTWVGYWAITTNYRSRVRGLPKTGPAARLAALCPEMAFVPASLLRYRAASRQWQRVLRSFPGVVVQKRSIDEAFLDLTQAVRQRCRQRQLLAVTRHPQPEQLAAVAQRRHSAAEAVWRAEEEKLKAARLQSGAGGSDGCVDAELLESSGSLRSAVQASKSTDPISVRADSGSEGGSRRVSSHRQQREKECRLDEAVKAMTPQQLDSLCQRLHPIDFCRACGQQTEPIQLLPTEGCSAQAEKAEGLPWLPWVGRLIMADDAQHSGQLLTDDDDEEEEDEEQEEAGSDERTDGEDDVIAGDPGSRSRDPSAAIRARAPPSSPLCPESGEQSCGAALPAVLDFSLEDADFPSDDYLLCVGSQLAFEIRQRLFLQTGFTTSAGIAPNPMLAKLASAMHKPNQQSIVRPAIAREFMRGIRLSRVSGFGPVQQERAAAVGLVSCGDVQQRSFSQLVSQCGSESFAWRLWDIASGVDHRRVEATGPPRSIGQSKRRPLRTAEEKLAQVAWLAANIWPRLREHEAVYAQWPSSLLLSWVQDWPAVLTRRCGLSYLGHRTDEEAVSSIRELATELLLRHVQPGILLHSLSIGVAAFVSVPSTKSIADYFSAPAPQQPLAADSNHRGNSGEQQQPQQVTDAAIDALFLAESSGEVEQTRDGCKRHRAAPSASLPAFSGSKKRLKASQPSDSSIELIVNTLV